MTVYAKMCWSLNTFFVLQVKHVYSPDTMDEERRKVAQQAEERRQDIERYGF